MAPTASLLPQHQKIRGTGVIDATDVVEAQKEVPNELQAFDRKLLHQKAEEKVERSPRTKALRLANSWTRIVLPRSFLASSSTTTNLAKTATSVSSATIQFQMQRRRT
jgi:hypothetical protein